MQKGIRISSFILSIFMFITIFAVVAMPAAAAEAYVPVNDIVYAAAEIIYKNEGSYATVVKDDNGALSIGKVQWRGNRALSLLKDIVARNSDNAWNILGQTLYEEITGSSDWGTRILNDDERSRISTIINTDEGRSVQDFYASIDIKSYILHAKYTGITDPKALIYYADVENQYGWGGVQKPAKRAVEIAGSYAAVTLDILHNATCEIYPSYISRRERTYQAAAAVNFTYTQETPAYEVWSLNGGVNMRTGPGTDYSVQTMYAGGTVINVYSKVDRGGYTWGETEYGWLVLDFCTYIKTVPASGSGGSDEPVIDLQGKGDANEDGVVSLADVLAIARYTLTEEGKINLTLADVTGEGAVSLADAILIARWILLNN